VTGPGQHPEYSEGETGDESPNGPAQDKFLCRLRNIVEVARIEKELSALEVIGALETVKLDIHASLPKEEEETGDED